MASPSDTDLPGAKAADNNFDTVRFDDSSQPSNDVHEDITEITVNLSTALVIAQGTHPTPLSTTQSNPITKCYWEVIPYELRDQLFLELDNIAFDEWQIHYTSQSAFDYLGKPPAILVALRGLSKSHSHALEWFTGNKLHGNGITRMVLHENQVSLGLTIPELDAIQSLRLDLSAISDRIPQANNPKTCAWFTRHCLDMSNVRKVCVVFDDDVDFNRDLMHTFRTQFPFWLEGFTALAHLRVEMPDSPSWPDCSPRTRKRLAWVRKIILRKTGINGTLNIRGPYGYQVWEWRSVEGNTMNWNQKLGRKYVSERDHETRFQFSDPDFHTNLGFEDGSFYLEESHHFSVCEGGRIPGSNPSRCFRDTCTPISSWW